MSDLETKLVRLALTGTNLECFRSVSVHICSASQNNIVKIDLMKSNICPV